MKTKKPKAKVVKDEQNDTFSITLKLGDLVSQGTGNTPVEALNSLPRPAKIMSKGLVIVSNGSLKREMLLQPVRVKRLFFNSIGVQEIVAKQLFKLLK